MSMARGRKDGMYRDIGVDTNTVVVIDNEKSENGSRVKQCSGLHWYFKRRDVDDSGRSESKSSEMNQCG